MSLEERLANVRAIGEARRKRNMQAAIAELSTAQGIVRAYRRKHSHEGSIWGFIMGIYEGSKSKEK